MSSKSSTWLGIDEDFFIEVDTNMKISPRKNIIRLERDNLGTVGVTVDKMGVMKWSSDSDGRSRSIGNHYQLIVSS